MIAVVAIIYLVLISFNNAAGCSWCTPPDIAKCGVVDARQWTLARAIGPTKGTWFNNKDSLQGTDAAVDNNQDQYNVGSFATAVPGFNQFLFVTGDCSTWLITSKSAVNGAFYSNAKRNICSSSESPDPYQAAWYNRNNCCVEDPWISTVDHGSAVGAGKIVYGENNFGSTHANTVIGPKQGVYVYIRNMPNLDSKGCVPPPADTDCSWCAPPDISKCAQIDDKDWTLARAIGPSKVTWFNNKDSLQGTDNAVDNNKDQYNIGSFAAAVPGFNQFLFITGDCSTWLIASKQAVNGAFYSNAKRDICASSESATPYKAAWYNRNGCCVEDPWISTVDHGTAVGAGKIVYGENNFGSTHANKVVGPKRGVYVYIRNMPNLDGEGCVPPPADKHCSWCKPPDIFNCASIDDRDWTLARAIGPSKGTWFNNDDSLQGTDYAVDNNKDQYNIGSFAAAVPGFNQFLFITGDCSTWLIASKKAVNGAFYSNAKRDICSSSERPDPYQAAWYNRNGCCVEDPWISTVDHGAAVGAGKIVYGENNFGSTHANTVVGPKQGVYVYIRNMLNLDSKGCVPPPADTDCSWCTPPDITKCADIDDREWTLARAIGPSKGTWFNNDDSLQGTNNAVDNNKDQYNIGSFATAVPGFNQFLFITGDCSTWLIASKKAVNGDFYSNAKRDICSSSESATPYQAAWYNRNGCCVEDPWISTVDHGTAVGAGKIVYGENNFGSTHAGKVVGPKRGVYIYIRNAGTLDAKGCVADPCAGVKCKFGETCDAGQCVTECNQFDIDKFLNKCSSGYKTLTDNVENIENYLQNKKRYSRKKKGKAAQESIPVFDTFDGDNIGGTKTILLGYVFSETEWLLFMMIIVLYVMFSVGMIMYCKNAHSAPNIVQYKYGKVAKYRESESEA